MPEKFGMVCLPLDSYADKIDSLSASIQLQLIWGGDCVNCGYCKDGGLIINIRGVHI